ncbi:MAG: hypothetical protein AAFR16_06215 [Pseudomonadota bacterium]
MKPTLTTLLAGGVAFIAVCAHASIRDSIEEYLTEPSTAGAESAAPKIDFSAYRSARALLGPIDATERTRKGEDLTFAWADGDADLDLDL